MVESACYSTYIVAADFTWGFGSFARDSRIASGVWD